MSINTLNVGSVIKHKKNLWQSLLYRTEDKTVRQIYIKFVLSSFWNRNPFYLGLAKVKKSTKS